MYSRKAIGILTVVILSLQICGCANRHTVPRSAGQPDVASARTLVSALDDDNLVQVQNQCGDGLQKRCVTWVPATAKALKQRFGRSKGTSFVSSGTPAEGWTEQIWAVQAERGDYQMRAQYLRRKIRHLEFRSSSDKPWTHVMEIASGQVIE